MGCHHSLPKDTESKAAPALTSIKSQESDHKDPSTHELKNTHVDPVPIPVNKPEPELNLEPDFHEAIEYIGPDYVSEPRSVDSRMVSSAAAENAYSQDEDSSDTSDRPVSPDLIVSPNPMSPANGHRDPPCQEKPQQPADLATRLGLVTPNQTGFVTPMEASLVASPRDHKSAFATPVSLPPLPESVSQTPHSTSKRDPNRSVSSTSFRSRISEVAELRNDKLCLQVFTFWRSDVLKGRVEVLTDRLDATAKASELILNENGKLKARITELEHSIQIMNSIEKKSVGTDSTDLDSVPIPMPPPQAPPIPPSPDTQASYATVMTRQPSVGGAASGFLTPVSASMSPAMRPVNIPIDQENHRRNWEDYLRPSSELPSTGTAMPFSDLGVLKLSPARTPTTQTPNIMSLQPPALSKDKLKAISDDLQKLTESLSVMNKRMGS